jgi:hypothetical protein
MRWVFLRMALKICHSNTSFFHISVTARSKTWVCGRLVAGIAGSNSAEDMDVCVLCLYVVLS